VTKDLEEESVNKWQRNLDENNKRENYERIFSRCGRKNKDEATTNTKLHSHSNRAWVKEGLPTSFQNNR
jgi:hypothetical protein